MDTKLLINAVTRRRAWLFGRLSAGKLLNLTRASLDFALKRERVSSLPAMVKIDISPLCNLRCTACVHAEPNGNPILEKQLFRKHQKMTVDQFRQIIEQIRGKTTAVSIYYLGDPMMHPDMDEMASIAADAGLQVHASTNFSFRLSDERIRSIVDSGLSHLTVCIDGLTQEKYQLTRVGGKIDQVIDNLKRLCAYRAEKGGKYPLLEVQYIMFKHNEHEVERARALCKDMGVNEFATFWGDLHNWTDRDPQNYEVLGPEEKKRLPRCWWPHFSTVIKYDGAVIPCCTYRQGSQYVPGEEDRSFGNVFEKGLEEIWNSEPYRQARRLVSDPHASERDPALKGHFCDSCPVLFRTTSNQEARWGNQHDFEELYEVNERGRPVRKAAPVVQGGK